jgi:hypothetical protein
MFPDKSKVVQPNTVALRICLLQIMRLHGVIQSSRTKQVLSAIEL